MKVELIVLSCLQFNPNVPILPNGIFLQGTTIDLLELDVNLVSLGVAIDEDGDDIEATLKVSPETPSFSFVLATGYL
jgi:hypothetical protein